ncbi:hypothetical protein DH2020_011275 [Rehmannia glutinosa]|uniref:Serine aminopeptidase S33 domain-containing protein n=1 Tax=Rehmannia glutinosa TaxID=99300 RepID=A0ABR0XCZ3_REHGL
MDYLNLIESPAVESPYELLLRAALLIPISHYLLGISLIIIVFLYNFLEFHFLQDLFTGFRGQPVKLTFNTSSQLYHDVVSKCRVLHGRQLFTTPDGGTIALDWVINAEVKEPEIQVNDALEHDGRSPIIIVIPGLGNASDASVSYLALLDKYVKHLAFKMAKSGCNVVVSNHRGTGGVPITNGDEVHIMPLLQISLLTVKSLWIACKQSDIFYTAERTEDLRLVIDLIHRQYPDAPLFAVGTSVGANILVKYLGEDGNNVPLIGAAAICSPWDSLIVDRFLRRRLVQRVYSKAMNDGMKDYANLHQDVLSRLSNWEAVKQSHTSREFDDAATRVLANCETVDTYYRRCASCNYVGSVKVPLLCISSMDDPICTSEAIPWDECRWVRAVDEFFGVLKSSPLSHRKKSVESVLKVQMPVSSANPQHTSIDKAPFVKSSENGIISAEDKFHEEENVQEKPNAEIGINQHPDITRSHEQTPVEKCLNQISSQNKKSLRVLVYIAIITTWPVVGSAVAVFLRKMFQDVLSDNSLRR